MNGELVVILLILILLFHLNECHKRRLENDNLGKLSYDEIHEVAILDQIDHHVPVIKSLRTRQVESLNGMYDFCFDTETRGFDERWFEAPLNNNCDPQNFYKMPVPSAFNDIVPNTTSRGYIGWFWYQTYIPSFWLPVSPKWNWFLQFDSVNYMAVVWLQPGDSRPAHLIGSHVGGHLPMTLNISSVLYDPNLADSDHIYRLTIAVSNRLSKDTIPSATYVNLSQVVGHKYELFQPDFDFYHFAGIMGNVNLIRLPKVYVSEVVIIRQSPQSIEFSVCLNDIPDKGSLTVKIQESQRLVFHSIYLLTTVVAQYNAHSGYCIPIRSLFRRDTRKMNENSSTMINNFSRHYNIRCSLRITNEPDQNGRDNDSFEVKLSIPSNTPQLNGTRQLQGFGMHHEQLFSGRTMSLAAIMKDIYLLKQLGANIIRTSHYPYSEDYLDACDDNNILVIAECPAVGLRSFSEIKLLLHKQILLEMMQRDSHHSSIVMWSIANEPESQKEEARVYFQSLLRYAREELAQYTTLANRPLTAAIAQSHRDDKIGDLLDVIMVNRYYGWYEYTGVIETIKPALVASLTGWAEKYRNKPLILSEFGADTIAGLHKSTNQIFSEEYQRDLLVEHEHVFDELVRNRSNNGINFLGSMIWNFADFSTHDSILRVGGNKKGIFTQNREPKLAVESIKKIYQSRLES